MPTSLAKIKVSFESLTEALLLYQVGLKIKDLGIEDDKAVLFVEGQNLPIDDDGCVKLTYTRDGKGGVQVSLIDPEIAYNPLVEEIAKVLKPEWFGDVDGQHCLDNYPRQHRGYQKRAREDALKVIQKVIDLVPRTRLDLAEALARQIQKE